MHKYLQAVDDDDAESTNTQSMGTQSMGTQSMGTQSMGAESMAAESMGTQALGTQSGKLFPVKSPIQRAVWADDDTESTDTGTPSFGLQSMGAQSMGLGMGSQSTSIRFIADDYCLSMGTQQWVKSQSLQLDSEKLARLTRKVSQSEDWVDDIFSRARTPDEPVDSPLYTPRDSLDMDWLPVSTASSSPRRPHTSKHQETVKPLFKDDSECFIAIANEFSLIQPCHELAQAENDTRWRDRKKRREEEEKTRPLTDDKRLFLGRLLAEEARAERRYRISNNMITLSGDQKAGAASNTVLHPTLHPTLWGTRAAASNTVLAKVACWSAIRRLATSIC